MQTLTYPDKIREIIDTIAKHHSKSEPELVEKAYTFAQKAHEGQYRQSGEPYIIHPVEVGLILAKMKMDPITVSAGLLHDVLEDTHITKKDLEREFGEEIAFFGGKRL